MRGDEEDLEMAGFYIPEIGVTKEKAKFFSSEGKESER